MKDKLIEDLKIRFRTYNCLKRHGINTVNELSLMSHEDLLKVRNLSSECIVRIKEVLKEEVDLNPIKINDPFKLNQIVYHRERNEFGIFNGIIDDSCSCVTFEIDSDLTVETKWLTKVDQIGALKIIRKFNEYQKDGTIDLEEG